MKNVAKSARCVLVLVNYFLYLFFAALILAFFVVCVLKGATSPFMDSEKNG